MPKGKGYKKPTKKAMPKNTQTVTGAKRHQKAATDRAHEQVRRSPPQE